MVSAEAGRQDNQNENFPSIFLRAALTHPHRLPRTAMAANLLPELLLALVGYPGDAFASGDQIGIALVDAIDWVTPSER